MHVRTIDSFQSSLNALNFQGGLMKSLIFAALSLQLLLVSQLHAATDALDEVNAVREKRGLPKFVRDEGLTKAAEKCADYRASKLIAGHTSNDFSFVPAGFSASAAGCAAWPEGMGWGSCCTYESYKHAGAAWAKGRDGRRYMHLFVRGGGDGGGSTYQNASYGRRGRR